MNTRVFILLSYLLCTNSYLSFYDFVKYFFIFFGILFFDTLVLKFLYLIFIYNLCIVAPTITTTIDFGVGETRPLNIEDVGTMLFKLIILRSTPPKSCLN